MDTKNFNLGRRERAAKPRYSGQVDEYGFELTPDAGYEQPEEQPGEFIDEPPRGRREPAGEPEAISDDTDPREDEYEDYDEYEEPQKKVGFFAGLFGRKEKNTYDEEYADDYAEPEPDVIDVPRRSDKRRRDRKVIEDLHAELPAEPTPAVLTFIVPREELPNLARLTPLGAPARRKPRPEPVPEVEPEPEFIPAIVPIIEPEPEPVYDALPGSAETMLCPACGAKLLAGVKFCGMCGAPTAIASEPEPERELIYDAESGPAYEPEPEIEPEYVPAPRLSRREERKKRRSKNRFKLMVDFYRIRGVDLLTPYGKPIAHKNRTHAAPVMAAAIPDDYGYHGHEPRQAAPEPEPVSAAPEPVTEPPEEHVRQADVTDEPLLDDEDDGLSLPIDEGFGFEPAVEPERVAPVRAKKKRLHYALGVRRISPKLARRLKPYTLPPVDSAPPKRERLSVKERAAQRRAQRNGRNDY